MSPQLGVSEENFEAMVVAASKIRGWLCYHTYDSRRSGPGFPDLVLVHPESEVLYRELKTESGKMTTAQEVWRERLCQAGANVKVWRPSDWEEIEKVLVHSVTRRFA